MAVRSLTRIPTYIFIPPNEECESKIEVYTSAGETIDITEDIVEGEYTDGVTETIGNFTFTVDNDNQQYTNRFNLHDEIRIYSDYATSATTLRFKGLIEKVSSREEDIVLIGRSLASKVMDITVTYTKTDYTHKILQAILTKYVPSPEITQNNIDTTEDTDTIVTVNWYQRPFWECVLELCNRSGYDAYIDCNSDFNYFVSGSRSNTSEAVVHDSNLINVGDFTPDLTVIKNRVIVYGAKIEDMQIVWTEEDKDSIDSYGVKELIINDTNIITTPQAYTRALYELSLNKDPPIVGEITSEILATILPGEKILISDQVSSLYPTYYEIQKFTQNFGEMITILTIKKEQSTLPKILKKRITFETQAVEMENPNEMRYSWLFDFNTDSGTHTSTEITEGRLKLQTGQSSGNWVSEVNSLSLNAISSELRVKGEALPGTSYYVSVDNGANWQPITLNTLLNLSPPGQNLKIKVGLNSASTQVDSLLLLYK